MNLTIDATYSLGSELSGVGVYSRELLHALAAAHPEERFRWAYRPHRFLKALGQPKPRNASRAVLWNSLGSRRGLFHGLNQRLPARGYAKQIATFHDLFVLTGEYSTPEFKKRFAEQAKQAAQNADCILAVSQFTADQVHRLLEVERQRIQVIHHGIVPRPAGNTPREKMVLCVGAIQTRKNTARLIQAFGAMPQDWRLVLAGAAGFGAEAALGQLPNHRITVTGYIPDAELNRLYSRASLFAFPSLDEGFGMPVLEAMAAGVPVITSNCSAMPEVAGNAAMLIDPLRVDQLAHALTSLAGDPAERERLSEIGLAWAKNFTWERAARETWAVYQRLISLPQPQSLVP